MTPVQRLENLSAAKEASLQSKEPVNIIIGKEHFQYHGGKLSDYELELPTEKLAPVRALSDVRGPPLEQTQPSVQRMRSRA
jgi:hypothetical protein